METGRPGAGLSRATPASAVQMLRFTQHGLFAAVVLVGLIKGLGGDVPLASSVVSCALVAWYVAGLWLEQSHRTVAIASAWLVVLTGLCVAAVFVSSDFAWVSFAIFVLYASVLPPKWAYGAIGTLALAVGAVLVWRWPSDRHWAAQFIGPVMGAAAAAALVSVYRTAARESRERQELIDELLRTQDDLARANLDAGVQSERARVAAEIHDTLAQGFASTVFLGRKALRALDSAEEGELESTLHEMVRVGSTGLEDARRLVRGLPPHELNDHGLADALGVLVARVDRAHLRVDGTPRVLPAQVETALLRVAQEGMSNALEHSEASRVVVTLTYGADEVNLDVVDDGKGFVASDRRSGVRDRTRGFGLGVMARRIEDLGGTFSIESALGSGTAIAATIELKAVDADLAMGDE